MDSGGCRLGVICIDGRGWRWVECSITERHIFRVQIESWQAKEAYVNWLTLKERKKTEYSIYYAVLFLIRVTEGAESELNHTQSFCCKPAFLWILHLSFCFQLSSQLPNVGMETCFIFTPDLNVYGSLTSWSLPILHLSSPILPTTLTLRSVL